MRFFKNNVPIVRVDAKCTVQYMLNGQSHTSFEILRQCRCQAVAIFWNKEEEREKRGSHYRRVSWQIKTKEHVLLLPEFSVHFVITLTQTMKRIIRVIEGIECTFFDFILCCSISRQVGQWKEAPLTSHAHQELNSTDEKRWPFYSVVAEIYAREDSWVVLSLKNS
jgi:hypothetical protein